MSEPATPNPQAPSPFAARPAVPKGLVVTPARSFALRAGRRLTVDSDGIAFRTPIRTTHVAFSSVRFVRRGKGAGAGGRAVDFAVTDGRAPVWPLSDDDWESVKEALASLAPLVPIDPPQPKPYRIAADAALRTGDDPAESLRSVRRAMVGRWWVQVRPWAPGFRAEAHTISGPASLWAGELRPTLAEATVDAIAMIEDLRQAD